MKPSSDIERSTYLIVRAIMHQGNPVTKDSFAHDLMKNPGQNRACVHYIGRNALVVMKSC